MANDVVKYAVDMSARGGEQFVEVCIDGDGVSVRY